MRRWLHGLSMQFMRRVIWNEHEANLRTVRRHRLYYGQLGNAPGSCSGRHDLDIPNLQNVANVLTEALGTLHVSAGQDPDHLLASDVSAG